MFCTPTAKDYINLSDEFLIATITARLLSPGNSEIRATPSVDSDFTSPPVTYSVSVTVDAAVSQSVQEHFTSRGYTVTVTQPDSPPTSYGSTTISF